MADLKNLCHDNVDDFNAKTVRSHSNVLRVLQWNVRGVNEVGKFDTILEFLDNLCVPMDVIVLGETWLKDVNCSLYNVRGYNATFSCRESSSGGLAVYVRNTIECQTIENMTLQGLHHVHLRLKQNGMSYDIHGVYRPPSFDFSNFQIMLENWLCNAPQSCPTFIVGDLNIPINLSNNNIVIKYKNLLESYCFLCSNTYATRPVSSNILDHFVCSFEKASSLQNDTIFSNVSDHIPVVSTLALAGLNNRVELSKKIVNHNILNTEFKAYVDSIEVIEDVNSCINDIINKYNSLLQSCTKTVKKRVNLKGTQCPWMTLDLWQLIKIKNNHLKKVKRNPGDRHAKEMLDHISKKVERCKKACKRAYYEKILNNTTHSKLWKNINQIFGRFKNSNNTTLIVNGRKVKDDAEKCELFNEYFSTVGHNLASKIPIEGRQNPLTTVTPIRESIFLRPSSSNEIINIIHNLSSNKSPGPDNIPASIIKYNATTFSNILNTCFNKIIATGQYPRCLKESKVCPIYKSGDSCLLDNYRPISTLSVFNKVFEKLLANRLVNFFEKHNVIYKFQYGFRQACSTTTALTELVDFVVNEIDCRKIVGALFIDLKKAFDTLNHEILLNKLRCYGVRGLVNDLFRSYLSNRTQFVCINDKRSSIKPILTGVPQGSNIGPLLFLVYINDLGNLSLSGTPRLFADDTALFYPDSTPHSVVNRINQDLVTLKVFFSSNLLSLNIQKTKYMLFRSPRKKIPPHLDPVLENTVIDKVDSFKYLGIHLDSTFSWETQIKSVEKKVSTLCGVLRRVTYFLPRHALLKFYYAHIHSQMQYAIIVWGRACKSKLMRLQTLQNRCLKMIFQLPPLYPTIDLYANNSHNILPLLGLCELQTLILVHNITCNSDTHSNIIFPIRSQIHNTRQAGNLALTRASSNHGQKRISCVGPPKYNALPNELKHIISKSQFKLKIKKYLKGKINEFML